MPASRLSSSQVFEYFDQRPRAAAARIGHGRVTNHTGQPVGRLEGPLRWVVDVAAASVAIAGPLPPPTADGA